MSADCQSTRWKAANQLRLCITVCQKIPAPRPSKKFGLQILVDAYLQLGIWRITTQLCRELSMAELASGGPGVGALHGKGSEYFYLWNSLQGS
jgi:hypothetical protein